MRARWGGFCRGDRHGQWLREGSGNYDRGGRVLKERNTAVPGTAGVAAGTGNKIASRGERGTALGIVAAI